MPFYVPDSDSAAEWYKDHSSEQTHNRAPLSPSEQTDNSTSMDNTALSNFPAANMQPATPQLRPVRYLSRFASTVKTSEMSRRQLERTVNELRDMIRGQARVGEWTNRLLIEKNTHIERLNFEIERMNYEIANAVTLNEATQTATHEVIEGFKARVRTHLLNLMVKENVIERVRADNAKMRTMMWKMGIIAQEIVLQPMSNCVRLAREIQTLAQVGNDEQMVENLQNTGEEVDWDRMIKEQDQKDAELEEEVTRQASIISHPDKEPIFQKPKEQPENEKADSDEEEVDWDRMIKKQDEEDAELEEEVTRPASIISHKEPISQKSKEQPKSENADPAEEINSLETHNGDLIEEHDKPENAEKLILQKLDERSAVHAVEKLRLSSRIEKQIEIIDELRDQISSLELNLKQKDAMLQNSRQRDDIITELQNQVTTQTTIQTNLDTSVKFLQTQIEDSVRYKEVQDRCILALRKQARFDAGRKTDNERQIQELRAQKLRHLAMIKTLNDEIAMCRASIVEENVRAKAEAEEREQDIRDLANALAEERLERYNREREYECEGEEIEDDPGEEQAQKHARVLNKIGKKLIVKARQESLDRQAEEDCYTDSNGTDSHAETSEDTWSVIYDRNSEEAKSEAGETSSSEASSPGTFLSETSLSEQTATRCALLVLAGS
jgi:hypothetical protein